MTRIFELQTVLYLSQFGKPYGLNHFGRRLLGGYNPVIDYLCAFSKN